MMMLLGINSLTASLMDIKPYLHLQLVPHITKYHQVSCPTIDRMCSSHDLVLAGVGPSSGVC